LPCDPYDLAEAFGSGQKALHGGFKLAFAGTEKRVRPMRATWAWTGLILIAIAASSYSLYVWLQPRQLPQQVLYGNGHVEGTDVRVATEVAGRVVENKIVEGVTVQRGDLLLRLDDSELTTISARRARPSSNSGGTTKRSPR
jgi:multidrug resistance efflux pump